MKNNCLYVLIIVMGLMMFVACGKDEPVNPQNQTPLVTPKGTINGTETSAVIGFTGGTLTSSDGRLVITFPSGALTDAALVSITPISNECPGASAGAYRLGPEGLNFFTPVGITFNYVDSTITDEKYLGIAYQAHNQTWLSYKSLSKDIVNNTITVTTSHFSDWALFERVSIQPVKASVLVDASLPLKVIVVGTVHDTVDEDGIPLQDLNLHANYTSSWKVNGGNGNATSGYIVKQGEDKATYSAPSSVPAQNPVAVSAALKNVTITQNGETFNDPQIIAKIRVIGKRRLYAVDFTSSQSIQPVGPNVFTLTDRGSMAVLVEDDSVTVYAIQSFDGEVTPSFIYDPSSECTTSVVHTGDGHFNVSPGVSFAGIYLAATHSVYVGVSSIITSFTTFPAFMIQCSGSMNMSGGDMLIAFPSSFSFDANKTYQEMISVIPGGGAFPDGFLKTAVTRVQ